VHKLNEDEQRTFQIRTGRDGPGPLSWSQIAWSDGRNGSPAKLNHYRLDGPHLSKPSRTRDLHQWWQTFGTLDNTVLVSTASTVETLAIFGNLTRWLILPLHRTLSFNFYLPRLQSQQEMATAFPPLPLPPNPPHIVLLPPPNDPNIPPVFP
jgi:hypothetical protein